MFGWLRRLTGRWFAGMSLVGVLERCRALTAASDDSAYSAKSAAEIVAILDRALEALREGKEPDREALKILFAPTAGLQEISIDNGWGAEFIHLSANFDLLI